MSKSAKADTVEPRPEPRGASRPSRSQLATPLWLLVVLLAVIATLLVSERVGSPEPSAFGQATPLAGARGIFAFTGQLDRDSFGLFMLDVDQGTIWCYELISEDQTRKLRLVAARSFVYDRYLQDFNVAQPSVQMIRDLVARQRNMVGLDDVPPNSNNGSGDATGSADSVAE